MADSYEDFVHFVRLVVDGRPEEVSAIGRRILRQVAKERPDLAVSAHEAMAGLTTSVLRRRQPREVAPVPVDADSRLELLRRDTPVDGDRTLRWPGAVQQVLDTVVRERELLPDLLAAGLMPTRSLLFVGPPGVGKTVAAHELARRLGRDLLTLDLAAVMSSYLGRTGNNVRAVLAYAARENAVLLLDEFDSIAKRRDDATDVGELRRLVTVLLQTIDDWPTNGLLIAATNHADLLDPAVWRRFEKVVRFPFLEGNEVGVLLAELLGDAVGRGDLEILSRALSGQAFADVTRLALGARREAVVSKTPVAEILLRDLAENIRTRDRAERLEIAAALERHGVSQRRVHDITGLSRDTLRKHRPQGERGDGS